MTTENGTKRRGRLTVDFGVDLWRMICEEAERRSSYNRVLPSQVIREAVYRYLTGGRNPNAMSGVADSFTELIKDENSNTYSREQFTRGGSYASRR